MKRAASDEGAGYVEVPEVVHALRNDLGIPLAPGAYYETMCGTSWQYQPIPEEEMRTRYVCAMCHQAQMTELLAAMADMVDRFNSHLQTLHELRPSS